MYLSVVQKVLATTTTTLRFQSKLIGRGKPVQDPNKLEKIRLPAAQMKRFLLVSVDISSEHIFSIGPVECDLGKVLGRIRFCRPTQRRFYN